MKNYQAYISISSSKRFGKACIKGTRISVYDVLNWLASGMSHKDILRDYPELKEVHIQAALSLAADREHKLRVA
ncbi:MAG: DUF433 domain-containing protein [Bacteroidetes bacterium]|nr:DUF433 domain-containing protein [Bacteroidota bacterium]